MKADTARVPSRASQTGPEGYTPCPSAQDGTLEAVRETCRPSGVGPPPPPLPPHTCPSHPHPQALFRLLGSPSLKLRFEGVELLTIASYNADLVGRIANTLIDIIEAPTLPPVPSAPRPCHHP